MAYGEIKVYGSDVIDALTTRDRHYNKVLNEEGEPLADMIAKRIMEQLSKRLVTPKDEDQ